MGFRTHFLRKYNDKLILKELEDLRARLYKEFGLDDDSGHITIERNANGEFVIIMNMPFSMISKLSKKNSNSTEWNYGVFFYNYQLRTGFGKYVDEELIFVEGRNILDKTKVHLYKNASELAEAIKIVNPSLKDRVVCIENKIEIIGAVNNVYLPSTDLVYDGDLERVYSLINPDYVFEIKFINAHQRDMRSRDSKFAHRAGDGTKVTAVRESLQERREQQQKDEDGLEGINLFNVDESIMNYQQMLKVHAKYKKKIKSKLLSYEVKGGKQAFNYDVEIVKHMTQEEKKILKINWIWINAYTSVMGASKSSLIDNRIDIDDALPINGYGIQKVFDALTKCDNMSLTSIIDMMIKGEDMSYEFMMTVINFISNPAIANMFDINLDMTSQAGIKYMNVVLGKVNPEHLNSNEPSVMEKYYQRYRKNK